MDIADQLAEEIAGARYEDMPAAATTRVRDGILDTVAATFLGYSHVGASFVALAKRLGGAPQATLFGDGAKVAAMYAAGANASMSGSTDFTEMGPGHGALNAIVHAGLSVAEHTGAGGQELIVAVALGYELSARFHRAAFPLDLIHGESAAAATPFPERGSHRHQAATIAATAAKLLRLDAGHTAHALRIAWHWTPLPSPEASGVPVQAHERGTRNLGICQWGIQSALMATDGFEGLPGVIEAERLYDPSLVVTSPSPYHHVEGEMHLKPWISSRGTQGALAAALEIIAEEQIAPAEITGIRLKAKSLYQQYPFDNPAPRDYYEAVNSVQWSFAMAILGNPAGPAWVQPERLNDPAALALAAKVTLHELPRATEIWESGIKITNEAPQEVDVVARGQTVTRGRTYGEAPGSSLNPMTPAQLRAKLLACAVPVIGTTGAEMLAETLATLDAHADLSDLGRLLTATAAPGAG